MPARFFTRAKSPVASLKHSWKGYHNLLRLILLYLLFIIAKRGANKTNIARYENIDDKNCNYGLIYLVRCIANQINRGPSLLSGAPPPTGAS